MKNKVAESLLAITAALLVAVFVGWAGSHGGIRISDAPLFALAGLFAFLAQWAAFVPSYLAQTERYYDLIGGLTYLAIVVATLFLAGTFDARSVLLASLVSLWALRLGSFLYRRIRERGTDERFDDIKPSFSRYLMAWTLQGLWVFLTLSAALAAMTSAEPEPLGALAAVGLALWAAGVAIEVVSDRQKRLFRDDPENRGRFITTGLWAWSRHPNYFGEITLWIGIALIALPSLSGWQYVTLVSPVFVFLLLTRVSGIPLLEARAERRWGEDPQYQAYRARTPRLIPRPPRSRA